MPRHPSKQPPSVQLHSGFADYMGDSLFLVSEVDEAGSVSQRVLISIDDIHRMITSLTPATAA